MKVRDDIRMLRNDYWFEVCTRGSHRQFKHPSKPGRVTVSGNDGKDVPLGTLKRTLRQAQLENRE